MDLATLKQFTEHFDTTACVLSVTTNPDGSYDKICLEGGNDAYIQSFPSSVHFVPGSVYTTYIPQDLNFEHFIYSAAVLKKNTHAYVYSDFFGAWFNIFSFPIKSDNPNKFYCVYTQEVDENNDPELMAKHSAKISSEVLKICIKLRESNDFEKAIDEVICDIRIMCKASQCCLLLTDCETGSTYLQSESIQDGTSLKSFKSRLEHPFPRDARTWIEGLAGSNCLIIRNEQDMETIKKRKVSWYDSLVEAGVTSGAIFPLVNKSNIVGFIWLTNFDTKNTDFVKETLELASFFIASDVANNQLFNRLEKLSNNDLLTGVKNRNAMNNWVTAYTEGKTLPPSSIGVIFLDLNGLKTVNDNLGHHEGDELLKTAANVLKKIFAECDIYRAGGDEFMIIAQNYSKEYLEKRILLLQDSDYNPSQVHFAVGFYYREGYCDIIGAMKKADSLMYENKNRYYAEHPELKNR